MPSDFPFQDDKNVATITCCHVIQDHAPILHASHDADDGMWQFLCGGQHSTDDAMVVGLGSVYQLDPSIGDIADLPLGCIADRRNPSAKWKVKKQR